MVSAHFYLFLIGGRASFLAFSGWIHWPTMLRNMYSTDDADIEDPENETAESGNSVNGNSVNGNSGNGNSGNAGDGPAEY